MNNENKLKRTYQNTDIKLLNWIEISDDRREFRMETTRINQRDGEAVVKVEHMVNGIIMIESIKTVPLSSAIGAEVQDKLTIAEIQDAEAGHEMNKQEEKRVTCEIISNLIEKENEQLSIDNIQTEEKKQSIDYKYKPNWLSDIGNKYWDEAYIRKIKRYGKGSGFPNNPKWENVVDNFHKDISNFMSKLYDYSIPELLDEGLVLCLMYGINPTSDPHPIASLKRYLYKREKDRSAKVKKAFKDSYKKLTKDEQLALDKTIVIDYNEYVVPFSEKCGVQFTQAESSKKKNK